MTVLFCTLTATLLATAEGSVNELSKPEPVYALYIETIEEELLYIEPTPEPTIVLPVWSEPEPTVSVPVVRRSNVEQLVLPTPKVPVTGVNGSVTHYGASYNGNTMGCQYSAELQRRVIENGGYGDRIYRSQDPSIAASAYDLITGSRPYACGTVLLVSGPAGAISVVIQDACPGCGWTHLDLSEEGITRVCGGFGRCQVRIDIK